MTPTAILGIDPGNTHSAAALIQDGRITAGVKLPNAEFLDWLKSKEMVYNCFNRQPFRVVCEMISPRGIGIGKETLDTCVMIGRIQALFPEMDRITRGAVKGCLIGKASGNDAQIRQCLIGIYGEPGTSKKPGGTYGIVADMWAALAVATAASRGCRLYETMGKITRKKKSPKA